MWRLRSGKGGVGGSEKKHRDRNGRGPGTKFPQEGTVLSEGEEHTLDAEIKLIHGINYS